MLPLHEGPPFRVEDPARLHPQVMKLTRFLGRSPDTATNEDLRRFQLHLTENRAGAAACQTDDR
jgi:hypothetical protein